VQVAQGVPAFFCLDTKESSQRKNQGCILSLASGKQACLRHIFRLSPAASGVISRQAGSFPCGFTPACLPSCLPAPAVGRLLRKKYRIK
jgi:hypothetical protein